MLNSTKIVRYDINRIKLFCMAPSSSPVRTQDFHSCNRGSNPLGVKFRGDIV